MPREYKRQGGHKGKKRKREDGDQPKDVEAKRHPLDMANDAADGAESDYVDINTESHGDWNQHDDNGREEQEQPLGGQDEFYGLLADDDQAYFKRIETILELDHFETPEDKDTFLDSVWSEADGKELKLACSQSCSRVLERLIRVSRAGHLKQLFQKFNSHFLFLVQHRFASHCCETLFVAAAPMVTQELIAPMDIDEPTKKVDGSEGVLHASMENLFLYVVNELSENMGFLMTDPFASHTLRVLLVVLSGKPLDDTSTVSAPPTKNKAILQSGSTDAWRTVPSSFHDAIHKSTATILGGLDTHYLRTLATNPLASQILQRLIEIEFHQSTKTKTKSKPTNSLYHRLVPDDAPTEETDSGRWLRGILYDAAGSRLLEVIVQCAPGKVFKQLHRSFFQPQLQAMARNDTASFVLVRVVERLNLEDLQHAMKLFNKNMAVLVDRSRHAILRALLERSRLHSVNIQPFVHALEKQYGAAGPDTLAALLNPAPSSSLAPPENPLQTPDASATNTRTGNSAPRHHARLLLSSMLSFPDAAQTYILTSLTRTDAATLLTMSQDKHATHVVQTALTHPSIPSTARKILIQRLTPHTHDMATDANASRVVDALWQATHGSLFFLKERIVDNLAAHESKIRETLHGRAVCRNWRVELWSRRRVEWIAKAKKEDAAAAAAATAVAGGENTAGNRVEESVAENQEDIEGAEEPEMAYAAPHGTTASSGKSAIELARERWAAKQKKGGRTQDSRVVRVK